MKPAYYNEFDPHAAAWLRGLIAAGVCALRCAASRSWQRHRAASRGGICPGLLRRKEVPHE